MIKGIKEQVDKIFENIPDEYCNNFILEYSEAGYVENIKLHIINNEVQLEIYIYNSEDSDLKWLELQNDYEPFIKLLKRKINDSIKSLKLFKSIV